MSFDMSLLETADPLLFDPCFIDPALPSGLWFCDSPESVSAISINAVCLRATSSWNDITACEEFFKLFSYILIVSPNAAKRTEMVREICSRITTSAILVAEDKSFRGFQTVWDLRNSCGLDALQRILLYTRELPTYGLTSLSDVEQPDMSNLAKVGSGIRELDQLIGGFYMGELSIWTGKRGEGKSTFLDQLLLEAVDQDEVVCAYSGELPDWRFKQWALLQAAGPKHIVKKADPVTGHRMATVPENISKRIDEWWSDRFFLRDIGVGSAHDVDSILKVFEYAHLRYGASVFLVDNIMTAQFKSTNDNDYNRAQSNFVGRLVEFSKKNNVHTHLVAHPRKSTNQYLRADDVLGSGDITNRADNVFSIERELTEIDGTITADKTVLSILKNRAYGSRGNIELAFEKNSKRFYRPNVTAETRSFGWDCSYKQLNVADIIDEDPWKDEKK